jgi:hypothetical protein
MYQSRKRKYTSRQERYERTSRLLKILAVFAVLGGGVWVFFRRQAIWDWMCTFTY